MAVTVALWTGARAWFLGAQLYLQQARTDETRAALNGDRMDGSCGVDLRLTLPDRKASQPPPRPASFVRLFGVSVGRLST